MRDATPLIEAAAAIRGTLGRPNDPSTVLPLDTLNRIEALAAKETVESVPTGLLDEAGRPLTREVTRTTGGDGTITYGELTALRPQLSAAVTKARQAGEFMLADNIRRLQAAIDDETARLAAESSPAGQRAATASRLYREEFAPVWNPGPGDEATKFRKELNLDRTGRSTTPPSATAGRFLKPGQPEKSASLQRIIETTPDPKKAQAEARRYLIADMAGSGVIDPQTRALRPDTLRKWRSQWGSALDAAPGFQAEVDQMIARAQKGEGLAGKLADDVNRARQNLTEAQQNKSALGLVLGKDPVHAVEAVFRSGDPERAMAEIVRTVGHNQQARDGLKAAVRDHLMQRATTAAVQKTADRSRPVDFAKLDELFARNERALAEAFSPAEMNALRQAHKLLRPLQDLKVPAGAAVAPGQTAEQLWRLLNGGLKARYGVLKGGGILRTIKIFVSNLPDSKQSVDDLLAQMWFDPELAMHLLGRNVDAGGPAWNAKLLKLLGAAEGAREAVAPK